MSLPSETCFPCKRLCRRGELIGLQWNCVDLDKGIMMIKQGLLYTKEKGVYVGPPKTGRPRAVCLAPETIEVLKKWKTEQLRTPDCPRSCRGKRCPCRCLLRFKRGITFNTPSENFHVLTGGAFLFSQRFCESRSRSPQGYVTQDASSARILGQAASTSALRRMGTSRHCLPRC